VYTSAGSPGRVGSPGSVLVSAQRAALLESAVMLVGVMKQDNADRLGSGASSIVRR
jgi:hypothetical protein